MRLRAVGVGISFFDRGVRLSMLDMAGRGGAPGEGSQPRPFEFFTRIASGETWGLTPKGEIKISK